RAPTGRRPLHRRQVPPRRPRRRQPGDAVEPQPDLLHHPVHARDPGQRPGVEHAGPPAARPGPGARAGALPAGPRRAGAPSGRGGAAVRPAGPRSPADRVRPDVAAPAHGPGVLAVRGTGGKGWWRSPRGTRTMESRRRPDTGPPAPGPQERNRDALPPRGLRRALPPPRPDPRRDPPDPGVRGVPRGRRHLGAPAHVHDRRAGAVLRPLQEPPPQPPCPRARPDPPDRPLARPGSRLDVVLHRRGPARGAPGRGPALPRACPPPRPAGRTSRAASAGWKRPRYAASP